MTIRGARYPSLFQINTRVWLTELARRLGRAVTLDDIPEQDLDRLASTTRRLARFLENHDEPRAAATFRRDVREAAAIVSFLSPGLRFFHQGQFEGRLKRISPHLVRAPQEPEDEVARRFCERLVSVLGRAVVRHGQWRAVSGPAAVGLPRVRCDLLVNAWRPTGSLPPSWTAQR